LENLADIGMGDFAGIAHFRRQPLAITRLGAFDRDTAVQLFVYGLIDHAHSTLPYFALDAEAAGPQISRREIVLLLAESAQWLEQKPVHSPLPIDVCFGLLIQFAVGAAFSLQEIVALLEWQAERLVHEVHQQVIIRSFVLHRKTPHKSNRYSEK